MFIKMDFENSVAVSSGTTPDQVHIKFLSETLFYDMQGTPIETGFELIRSLPSMLSNDTATAVI